MISNLNNLQDEIEDLVALVKQGDTDAFSKLYDIFINPLYRFLYFSAKSSEDIEDIASNVFIKVWEKIAKYNSQKDASFKSWFFRVAKNTLIDFIRGNKDTSELLDFLPDLSDDGDPKDMVEKILNEEKLKIALSKITPSYKEFLTLKFLGDFSNKEIAEIVGKNEDSLRVLQFRALGALKKELEENFDFEL